MSDETGLGAHEVLRDYIDESLGDRVHRMLTVVVQGRDRQDAELRAWHCPSVDQGERCWLSIGHESDHEKPIDRDGDPTLPEFRTWPRVGAPYRPAGWTPKAGDTIWVSLTEDPNDEAESTYVGDVDGCPGFGYVKKTEAFLRHRRTAPAFYEAIVPLQSLRPRYLPVFIDPSGLEVTAGNLYRANALQSLVFDLLTGLTRYEPDISHGYYESMWSTLRADEDGEVVQVSDLHALLERHGFKVAPQPAPVPHF